MVLLENVPGFLTSNEGNDFRDACVALNRLGYSLDALMIDALNFVLQSRQRLFIIGTKDLPQAPKVRETPNCCKAAYI